MITSSDVLELVKTKTDAYILQTNLDAVLKEVFTGISFEESLDSLLPHVQKEKLLLLLQKYHVDSKQIVNVQAFFEELKAAIHQLPSVSLTLAFAPKQQTINIITTWLLVHTKKASLLEITVDTTLIGGAVIEYKGIHKDFSIKKILQDKYEQGVLHFDA